MANWILFGSGRGSIYWSQHLRIFMSIVGLATDKRCTIRVGRRYDAWFRSVWKVTGLPKVDGLWWLWRHPRYRFGMCLCIVCRGQLVSWHYSSDNFFSLLLWFTLPFLALSLVSTVYLFLVIVTIIFLSPSEYDFSSWQVVPTGKPMIGFLCFLLHRWCGRRDGYGRSVRTTADRDSDYSVQLFIFHLVQWFT